MKLHHARHSHRWNPFRTVSVGTRNVALISATALALFLCDPATVAGMELFDSRIDCTTGNQPVSIAVLDLNDDGHLDLVTANYVSSDVTVLLGKCDGSYMPRVSYDTGSYPCSMIAGDLDGDTVPTWPRRITGTAMSPFSPATATELFRRR